jgi:hypothetical protein
MNKYEKLLIILPALADAGPFIYYLIIVPLWPAVPFVIALICSFAPQIIGISILITLPILRHQNIIPRHSDSILIGIVLAMFGILEPLFFY